MNRRQFISTGGSLAAAAQLRSQTTDQIERDRQAALDILKPSQRDLDYGLRLHRESLVFDAYGFSPRAAVDGNAVRDLMEQGASDSELQDQREDMTMTRAATVAKERDEFIRNWNAAGMTCIFQNCGEESSDPLRLIKRLARFTYLTDHLRGVLRRTVTPEDVVQAHADGEGCLYFTGNGVPLTQQWVSVEDELRYIRIFFQLGIRMMHVTYNRRNRLGDGCAETANGGLSGFRAGGGLRDEPRRRDRRCGAFRVADQLGSSAPILEADGRQPHNVRQPASAYPLQARQRYPSHRGHRWLCGHLLHFPVPEANRRPSKPCSITSILR